MKILNRFYLFFIVMAISLPYAACVPAIGSRTAVLPESALTAELEITSQFPTQETVDLRFTLKNNSQTALYVLKWYTPLEGIFGEIFIVQRDGRTLPYAGPLVMRGNPTTDDYFLIKPGASVSRVVNLATAYDFSHEGEYAIAFLSPTFSHVARSEKEMAKTSDDLGPIVITSNQVGVQIGSPLTLMKGVTRAEAAEMIQAYLHAQKPDPYPRALVTIEELPIPGMWESLAVQLFRITGGPSLNESFLIHGESVLQLGTAFGGRGLTSVKITDLDQDGHAELLFSYSFGSGMYQSRIGMYAPAYDDGRIFEAGTAYLGDLSFYEDSAGKVNVRVVKSDDRSLTLTYLGILGCLNIDEQDGKPALILQISDRVPEEARRNLFPVN